MINGARTMRHRRLELVINGRRRQLALAPLLSSARCPWSGFLLERHEVSSDYASRALWPRTLIVLVAVGSISVEEDAVVGRHRYVAGPGSVTIWPKGHESRSL